MRTSLLAGSAAAALLGLGLPGTPVLPAAPPALSAGSPPGTAYRQAAAAMSAAGEPYATWAADGRRFLAFDDTGDGTAVEVLGDLTRAERVVVLVPGVDTVLRDFDRGLGGVARRAPAVQARTVFDRVRATAPAAAVAVVAWLGYDPPEGFSLDVARDVRARSGATALTGFVRALTAQRPGVAVTLVGHSYGAIVVGLAAPQLREVTDVVALGAPGMGAGRAADLGGARVWAALAPTDWMRRVPQVRLLRLGHGRRPTAARFGALLLPTDGVTGHDGYLVPGSATLEALAGLILDRPTAGALP
jgi:hypothetical protein